MSRLEKLFKYAAQAKQQTGKSHLRQWMEIAQLAAGKHRLGLEEYYELEVFDDAFYAGDAKSDCIGWRASNHIDKQLNHDYWRAAANDKVLNYAILQQYGFPIPQTVATFSLAHRRVGGERLLSSETELRAYLADGIRFPVFVKPISGTYGRGTYLLTGYDAVLGVLIDNQGKHVALDEFVKSCLTWQYSGMLFQTPLQPHPEVLKLCGPATSCVRVILAHAPKGPEIQMTFWKVARTRNITDNFHMGSTGNLLAWIDAQTGTVQRVITGMWPAGQEVAAHPDTQETLVGCTLPHWRQAMDLCLAAAVHFPGLRLQHWDVAFCDSGPVLMELNTEADLGVPQMLGRRPFMNATVKGLMGVT
jgi:Sugar-transfer associated ATP-grasp